jgi:RNA-directed DNA polymerase
LLRVTSAEIDRRAERWRRHEATGDMIIVRYADDIVVGFEREVDARRFLDMMRGRFESFSLSLHPEKTRLIEFGRFAAVNRKRCGFGKPETFSFLGFTFNCGKSRRGKFLVLRKTRHDRMWAKLKVIKTGAATADAPVDTRAGKMAGAGRQRLLQLPRGAD